jgi:hypothetical protein
MPALSRPQKITFAEMRDMGVRGVLIYCADYRCSHSIAVSADQWPDDLRLSEDRFTCPACGERGVDVRPDFNWKRTPVKAMGYRWGAAQRFLKVGTEYVLVELGPGVIVVHTVDYVLLGIRKAAG